MSKVNLAIIGGGLVGASLALALQAGARERGWSIVLIEPFAPGNAYQPSYDARSSALSYGSRQIYERLGLWPAIAERAEPILHIHVSDRGRFGATRLTAIEEGVPALGYVVENAWLGQCLWKALDPEVVRWHCPAEVKTLEAREGGYRLPSTTRRNSIASWRSSPMAVVPGCANNSASPWSRRRTGRLR